MKDYKVTIKEILERTIEIKANSKEEAIESAREQYLNEDIILDYEDLVDTEYKIYNESESR